MSEQEALALIKRALHEVAPELAADVENLDPDTQIEDLAMDSVATLEMVGFVEDELAKTFGDDELQQVKRVRDLAALIQSSAG